MILVGSNEGGISVNPSTVRPEDDELVGLRLGEVLALYVLGGWSSHCSATTSPIRSLLEGGSGRRST
jgi:hypothetical protein